VCALAGGCAGTAGSGDDGVEFWARELPGIIASPQAKAIENATVFKVCVMGSSPICVFSDFESAKSLNSH
jgi:hypothetical protein